MAAPAKGRVEGKLTGLQKAAVILMSIDEEASTRLFTMMREDEIKEISHTMSSLGAIKADVVENVFSEFLTKISEAGPVVGSMESTERLLERALGKDKVQSIMEDISGPVGRTTWDKLNNVSEETLATYLKNEHPQTVALVLSKVKTQQAAKVLGVLPDELALEVIMRMIAMEPVKREVLVGIEKTLQSEFMSNLAATKKLDSYEMIAEVFNNFDRTTESKFMGLLETRAPDSATRIRELMFTFDDLISVDAKGIQTLMRNVDKDKLAVALKGASEEMRELFFSNMSERAAKIMQEDMASKGPVRMKDVDEAQMAVVNVARDLAESGEIMIADNKSEDQLVY